MASFNRKRTPGHIPADEVEGVGKFAGTVIGEFGRTARRYEVQAAMLTRGLHTALLVERFKKGLLTVRGRG